MRKFTLSVPRAIDVTPLGNAPVADVVAAVPLAESALSNAANADAALTVAFEYAPPESNLPGFAPPENILVDAFVPAPCD